MMPICKPFLVACLLFAVLPIHSFSQQTVEEQNVHYRADTVYVDTIIDGKKQVFREIYIYDTLLLFPPIKLRQKAPGPFSPYEEISCLTGKSQSVTLPALNSFEAGLFYSHHFLPGRAGQLNNYREGHDFMYGAGVFFHALYPTNQWYWRTGLDISYAQENVDYAQRLNWIDTSFNFIPYTFDSTIIDTSYFLDLNQLPDTVFIMNVDTFQFTVKDTLVEEIYDSVSQDIKLSQVNRYFFLEFPMLMGYSFSLGKQVCAVEAGLYFSWLAMVNGRAVDKAYGIRQLGEKYFHRVAVDGAVRLRYELPLNASCQAVITPVLRYSLFNIYRDDIFSRKKILRLGIAFGIKF